MLFKTYSSSYRKPVLNIINKLPELIIAALLFWYIGLSAFVDTFSSVWSLYDEKRAKQLLIIGISLLLVILSRNIRNHISRLFRSTDKYIIISLILLLTLSIISTFLAPFPIYAITETTTLLGLTIFTLVIASITLKRPNLIIFAAIAATWTFLLIYEIEFFTSYIASIIVDQRIKFELLFPRFGNVRFFNQFQIWLIPISLAPLVVLKINRRSIRYILYFIAGSWITILMTSQSRGAQLAFLAGLIITCLIYRKNSSRLLRTTLIVSGIGITIYLSLFIVIPGLSTLLSGDALISTKLVKLVTTQDSSLVRFQLWRESIEYILANPIFGIGPMHYAYYPGPHAHPHNSVLQIGSEFGLPFLILSLCLLATFIWSWHKSTTGGRQLISHPQTLSEFSRSKIENNQYILTILFFSLISGLIYSLVSGIFVMPMAQTMLAITLGLMIGLLNRRVAQASSISTFKSASLQIIAGIFAIGLLLAILPHLTTRVLLPFFGTYVPEYTAGPRYWEFGGLLQRPSPNTPFYYEHPALKESPKIDSHN